LNSSPSFPEWIVHFHHNVRRGEIDDAKGEPNGDEFVVHKLTELQVEFGKKFTSILFAWQRANPQKTPLPSYNTWSAD
jgi:hypothetical protein